MKKFAEAELAFQMHAQMHLLELLLLYQYNRVPSFDRTFIFLGNELG